MQGRIKVFILCGLGLSLALALFVSPFASTSPDGLDRFAVDQRIEEGEEAWPHAPMGDYQVTQVQNEGLSTGLAGVLGTLAVFGVMIAMGWALRRPGVRAEGPGET